MSPYISVSFCFSFYSNALGNKKDSVVQAGSAVLEKGPQWSGDVIPICDAFAIILLGMYEAGR